MARARVATNAKPANPLTVGALTGTLTVGACQRPAEARNLAIVEPGTGVPSKRPHRTMQLSIVIPTDGRRRTLLAAAIDSCLAQQLPDDVGCEIIVVDNTPQGTLRAVVAGYASDRLRWVHAPTPGVAQARNIGVHTARGTHVAFLDDDETAPRHWAGALLRHTRAGAQAVFGPVEAQLDAPGPCPEIAARMYSRRLDAADGADITDKRAYLGTGNSLFDKAACFVAAEPFCTELSGLGGEDSLFLASLAERGIRLTWAAAAAVTEHVPAERTTRASLALRHFRNGQIRSLACFRGGARARLKGVAWMGIGLAQVAGHGLASLALARIRPQRAVAAGLKAQGGLGKVLWMRPFWTMSYPTAVPTGDALPMPVTAATDPNDPLVSIIVVSYRTRAMTLECLRSVVRETKRASYELLVVDNASGDGSAEAIAAEFPEARLTALDKNVGFAAGNNIAAKEAKGSYLLLLNPDTIVLDGAIDRLVDFAQRRPQAAIWGGRTLYADRSLNPTSCWQRMTLWNVFCRTSGLAALLPNSPLFNAEAYGGWDRSTVREAEAGEQDIGRRLRCQGHREPPHGA